MWSSSCLRNHKRSGRAARRRSVSTQIEALEVRSLLSGLPYPTAATVTQLIADMNYADTTGGAFTVNLLSSTTFDLQSANNSTDGGNGLPFVGGAKAVALTLVGNGDTIERVGSASFRLFDVAAGSSLTLNHVTLQGGSVLGSESGFGFGGGIYNRGSLTIADSILSGNTASGLAGYVNAGGIYNSAGALTITNSILSGNTASWGNGGAIYNAGGTVLLSNSSLSNNVVSPPYTGGGGGYGGGIYNDPNGKVTVQNASTITGNMSNWFDSPYSSDVQNAGVLYQDITSTIGFLYGNPAVLPGKTYVGANGGNWSSASNWSPAGVPTGNDPVVIDGGHSVSLTVDAIARDVSVTGGATLNLNDKTLVVNYNGGASPVGSWNGSTYIGITALIRSGRNGGAWNGTGITSSTAAANPSRYAVGVTADASQVVVKVTLAGDANLDGKLNIDDYTRIDAGVGAKLTGWSNGDFNYDGQISIDDYVMIDGNIGKQGAPSGNSLPTELAAATRASLPGPVIAPTLTWNSLPRGDDNPLDLLA